MLHQGIIVARQYATELPSFSTLAEAEKTLLALRDSGLREILSVPALQGQLDYSPESLKLLEVWFFTAGQPSELPTGFPASHAIGFYLGEVYCRHAGFRWVVQEFAFAHERYEIGVERELLSIMLTKGRLLNATDNKRMQSLWREFKKYAPRTKSGDGQTTTLNRCG